MPVLPEQITTTVFRRHWRGYHPGQVDALLRSIQTDYTGAIERIAAMSDQRDRARTEHELLRQRTDAIVEAARREAAQLRREAEGDAHTVRTRAEQAAELIASQAEKAAVAAMRHAQSLQADAQRDAESARQRLDEADQRAHRLEDVARDRCDTMRAEADERLRHLHLAERRVIERIRHVENTLSTLRAQVSLLDQLHHAEQTLADLRAETHDGWPTAKIAGLVNGQPQ